MIVLELLLQDPISVSKRLDIVVPGSKIPEWFTRQSSKPSISIKQDPDWCNDKWIGLALSLCFRNACQDYVFCGIKFNRQKWGLESVRCPAKSENRDHLRLCYLPRDDHSHQEWQNYNDTSGNVFVFSFDTNSKGPDLDFSLYGPCDVCLVYEKDIQEFNQLLLN